MVSHKSEALCTAAAHRSASVLGVRLQASPGRKDQFLSRSFLSMLQLEC